MSHIFGGPEFGSHTPSMPSTVLPRKFAGRHYETGLIVNALAAMGCSVPESRALGASGGIAFGYFVFEYKGYLPHVALLTRNTFAPFERALDNLGIRREVFETVKPEKGDENLRRELDFGNPAIVWADGFSLPHTGLDCESWGAMPFLVVSQTEDSFQIVDGGDEPFAVPAETLLAARGRIKKERYRVMTLSKPNEERLADGLRSALATCAALYLDKPPAGSASNFGISGMRHWAKMLREKRNALCWRRKFEPGPRLMMALAGSWTQPGVWDWIEGWGTGGRADRGTFGSFLDEAADLLARPGLRDAAAGFRAAAPLWSELADLSLSNEIPEFRKLKELKPLRSAAKRSGAGFPAGLKEEMEALRMSAEPKLASIAEGLFEAMATRVDQIAAIEEEAILALRRA